MKILLDYVLSGTTIESKDGGHSLDFDGATAVNGPSKSSLGRIPKALRLEGRASARTVVTEVGFTPRKFTIRTVVRAVRKVNGRQNIIESSRFPFALFIDKGKTDNSLTVVGSVKSKMYGWRSVDSKFRSRALRINTWLSIDLVYDHDTLALFVGEELVDVQAFPRGALAALPGNELFIGSWVDGLRDRFEGDIAAIQVIAGAPESLETLLDEARSSPPWHISRKRIDVEKKVNLGAEASSVRFDNVTGAYTQNFQHGLIMYHDSIGAAFEMHGAIWNYYKGYRNKRVLGYLISDEGNSTKRGGRKSLFSRGGIYWSGATGAQPVLGQIYLDYENMGEAAIIGLPTGPQSNVSGGKQQIFQAARMYFKNGAARSHEVHGSILSRFLATGGVRKWGFPVTDEVDVVRPGPRPGSATKIGRSSEFEWATFFWSSRTGAFEVHGSIRKKYMECGGPAGELGFPTSDETDIPGASGPARINSFQKGSICWYGNYNSIVVARPFKVFVGRVATAESEGWGMGQNDLYTFIRASDGSTTYDSRHPKRGDWSGNNSKNINFTIPKVFTPNKINYKVSFRFKCVDSDPGNDDHLGTITKTLNAANGWGLKDNNGVYNNSTHKIRSLTWSVKPQVNIANLSEIQKWWGKDNESTNKISYQKYSRAFRDVDSDPEWWDISDWLEKAFYKLVVDDLASGGNCFGMALEGIYARKNRSVFGMPLDRFKTWSTLESEFNIKHCYQVGAQAIWWFIGQFVTGNTHDPRDVFNRSRSAFNRGEHPVVCIAQNYNFSGNAHCILPVGWHKRGSTWKMDILDPNFPGEEKALIVNASNNTFRYVGSHTYTGGEWTGGRFHYMPYDILDSIPRTPIWDAILLLLSGTVIVFGADNETVSIKDVDGRDLNAFSNAARQRLQRGEPVEDCFFNYRGFAGDALASNMLFRRNPLRGTGDLRVDGTNAAHTTINEAASRNFRAAQPLAAGLRAATPAIRRAIGNRTAHAVLADTSLQGKLSAQLTSAITGLASANREGAFDHKLRAKRNGDLEYAVCAALMAWRLDAKTKLGEEIDLNVRDLYSSKQSVAVTAPSSRLVDLTYETRLGTGKDRVEVKVSGIPAEARNPLLLNPRPGIGGIDIVSSAERVQAQISIRARISDRIIQRNYQLPMEGGARFQIGTALGEGELVVGRIGRLYGKSSSVITLQPGN